jgi:hypothetical protein
MIRRRGVGLTNCWRVSFVRWKLQPDNVQSEK